MKISKMYKLIVSCFIFILSLGISINASAQCGAESITTDQWCENGFAKWTFDSPTANTWYEWYSYTPAPYVAADFDANGHLIRTGTIFYDSVQTPYYYSPFRITTATAPPAGVQLTYIKRTNYPALNPKPATAPAFTSNAAGTVMEMSFTNTMPVRFNSIKVPVVLNTVGQTYKIQITFGTTAGPGSAVYNFSTVGATLISGNNYYVEVPINYTLTTTGTTKIVVNSNPTGTGSAVDGLLFSPAQPATTTGGPVTIPANSASTTGGKFGVLYDWNYTAICPPQTTPLSTKKTVGCCVPPASVNILTLSSNKATIVNGSENATLTVGNYSSASNYFDWYFNGVNVPAASGVGKTSYVTNQVGNWEVHELTGGSPAAADKTNPSCYSSDATRIDDKLIVATIVTAPSNSPLCIGDSWSLSGSGSSNLTWSTGGGTLSNTTGSTTTFTATQAGTTQVILTGTVTSGDLVVNGNFNAGATGFVTSMPGPVDPRSTDGSYNVASSAGNWGAQPDWTFNGTKPFVTGNPGNFLIINGEDASSVTKPVVWGQKINGLTANQAYTFSFDFTSICYVVSSNTGGYSNAPGTAPFYDVDLEVYINGVLIGSASTDFATNGGVNAVGVWKNFAYTWNSTTSTFANIEIRQKNLFPMRGYDFGLDNIKFGGLQTQTDAVTLGPITDCSAITATASACINDTYTDLTAVATGGLIFDHWELKSTGATVSTANPYRVQTLTATQYDAVGYMGIGNVLSNGDFNSGNIGFISGSPYYTYAGTGHGDNQYSVDVSISTHNSGWWIDIPQAPGQSATSMRYIADAKTGVKVLAWTFTANQNDKFAFSGYIANIHKDALGPDTTNTGIPSAIGIYINNVMISSYWTKNDRDWHQLTGNWTAPLAGSNTYTLEVRNLKINSGGGNDFALDDFKLVPLTGTAKKFTVTTPVCDPCLSGIPTVATKTFCGNTGTVKLTPAASDPASVQFNWYATASSTPVIGTSVGSATTTLDLTGIAADGSGNKTVYYQKSAKGAGTVYKKNAACTMTNNGWQNNWGTYSLLEKYRASKAIQVTSALVSRRTVIQNNGCGVSGVITFNVIPALANGNPDFASPIYGSLTANYSRIRTTPQAQERFDVDTLKGSVNVPAGVDFYIVPVSVTANTIGTNLDNVGQPCQAAQVYLNDGSDNSCDFTGSMVDDYDGTYVSRTGSYQSSPNGGTIKGGYTWNVTFNAPAYPCPRVPVVLTPNCPCTKPTTVVITAPATTPLTICQGTAQTLSGTATVTAASINGGFRYSWFKTVGSGSSTTVPLATGTVVLPANVATAVPNYTGITGALTDAGTYVLRVEDGTAGNSSCYTEATVVINIDPVVTTPAITAAQTICTGTAPAQIGGAAAAGGSTTATATYVWESSANGTTGWTTIAGATLKDYTPGTLTADTYYRRTDKKGVCAGVVSNVIKITVDPVVTTPAITAAQTICSGSAPAQIGGAAAAGGSATATATYVWESSANGTTGWTVIAGATLKDYTPGTLTADTYYRRTDKKGACTGVVSNVIKITVDPVVTTPAITAAQTICTGSAPAQIGGAAAAGGSTTATATYVWESSANGTTGWTTIAGATLKDYTPGTLTADTYYRRTDTKGVCAGVVSNVIKITVDAVVTTPAITADQTICSGSAPAQIGGAAAAGGSATATASYVWESSANGSTGWTAIAGATLKDYTPGTLTADTYYRRTDKKGACAGVVSNVVKITVDPVVTTPAITAAQTICSGSAPAQIGGAAAAGGSATATATYVWESSANGTTGWTTIAGATLKDYTPGTLTADTYYRRTDKKGACAGVVSNVVKITVDAAVTTPAITAAQTICSGSAPAQIGGAAATGGSATATATYVWESSANGTTGWTTIAGATLKDYTPGTLTADTYYRRTDTKGVCAGAVSNVIKITVDPAVTTPAITADQTICTGSAPAQIGGAAAAGGSTTATATYVWESSANGTTGWTTIAGATLKDYTPGTLTADTYYRRTDKKGVCAAAVSNVVKITVSATASPAITVTPSKNPICAGESVTFTATGTSGGAAPTFEWFIDGTSQGAPSTTATTFTRTTFTNGNQITARMVSSSSCAVPATVTSAAVTMTVNPNVTPTVTLTADKTTICPGDVVNYTATSTNGGTPTYTWNGTPTAAGTGATYSTTALTAGNSITVTVNSSLTCVTSATATSAPVVVTVTPVPTIGVSITPDKSSICANNPVVFTATVTGSGSTPAPTYQWFITNSSTTTPPGVSQGAPSTTATTFTTSALTATNNKVYVQVVSNATCASTAAIASNVVAITVNAGIGAGTIGTDQSICYNTIPPAFTETVAPIGIAGTPTYQWEASPTGLAGSYVSIPGATNSSYSSPIAITQDVYVRRIITDPGTPAPCNVATSNVVHITVRPQLVAGTIAQSQTICSGATPAPFTSAALPTGGSGAYTYQWQSDASGTMTNIANATNVTYAPGALTATTKFQRMDISGSGCGSLATNVVTVTITSPETVTASINDPGQVCAGSAAFTFTATAATTGTGSLSYEWFLGTSTTPVSTAATYTYSPVIADNNKTVKVIVKTSNGCNNGPATSNIVTLSIVNSTVPTVAITTINNPNCAGFPSTFTATATGTGSGPTYQWFADRAGTIIPLGSGTTGPVTKNVFTTTTLVDGDKIWVELTSNLGCLIGTNPFPSNKITMVIKPIPAPVINEGDQTICSPNTFPFTVTVGTGTTFEWYKNGIATGVKTATYNASESGIYTVVEDNGVCNSTSLPSTLDVVATPVANAGADIYIKEGDLGQLNGSGGALYTWTPATGLSDVNSNVPTFIADQNITYTLKVADASNTCSSTDQVNVFVEKAIVIPNVITVNGDGTNDTWDIKNIESFPNAEFLIYNRWGNLVWKSSGYPKKWDGSNYRNGEVLPEGTYFYIINLNSQIYTEPYTGWVQIIQ